MKKITIVLLALMPFYFFSIAQTKYHITNEVSVTNKDCSLSKLVLILPVPQSNNYQTIEDFTMSNGTIKEVEETGNKYLHMTQISNLPKVEENSTLSSYFNATLYPMYIDMSQFEIIYPYDIQSPIYQKYTVSKGEYLDIDNNSIKQIADQLWNEANGHLIGYAYACYLYVAENFSYLNPFTGIHPIANILSQGGGDCGNLASVFVNLLRVKGIPAKHIVTVRPNGSYHVWADFYLQNYGWIPVDVNMKLDYPNGNYFGYYAGDGIVMSEDICNFIEYDTGRIYNAVILQHYLWWYWRLSGSTLTPSHHVKNQIISSTEKPKLFSVDSNSATIKCDPVDGISGYKVKLYKGNNKQQLEKEFRFDGKLQNLLLNDLEPTNSYLAEVSACRMVDAIESTMGSTNISFTTNVSNEILSVEFSSLEFGEETNSKGVNITSNVNWTVSCTDSWLTISPISGSTDATITVTVTANTSTSPRAGIITIKGGNITKTITVTQTATAPTLSVSASALSFTAAGEQKTFTVSSNTDWNISSSDSWITVAPASGSNNGTVTVTAVKNETTTQRTATITVSGTGVTAQTIQVTQEAGSVTPEPPVEINPASISLNKSNLILLKGGQERLTATILPENAANKNVNWSSSNTSVATVDNNGTVKAISKGSATISVITETGGLEAKCDVLVEEQSISVKPSEPENNQGSLDISLNIPTDNSFSITFTITLPNGLTLNRESTTLVESLINNYTLTITPNAIDGWLFEIKPKILRSGETTTYQDVVHIVYTVDESISSGTYNAKISALELILNDGTTIRNDEITIPINILSGVGNDVIDNKNLVYYNNGLLSVDTPFEELITIYSITGSVVYNAKKHIGFENYNINLPKGIYIVKGNSGWQKKITTH